MTVKSVIYARVSTEAQAEGTSIDTQLAAMRSYCERHGMEVVKEISDHVSGTMPIRARDGGAILYDLVERKRVDAVVVYTMDRLARDEAMLEVPLFRFLLKEAGVALHCFDSGLSDPGPIGAVIDTFRSFTAAEERKKIRERSMRGRRAKAANGLWVGEGAEPFGYRRCGFGKGVTLVVDECEADVVRRIFCMQVGAGGQKPIAIRRICEMLTEEGVPAPGKSGKSGKRNTKGWHPRSVHMILTRRLYIGEMAYPGLSAPVPMPALAIVDRQIFDAAQNRLKYNRDVMRGHRVNEYLLRGRLRCHCGRAMIGRVVATATGARYKYYYCAGQSLPKHLRTCYARKHRADALEGSLWQWVTGLTTDESQLAEALNRLADRRDTERQSLQQRQELLKDQSAQLEAKIRRMVSRYADAGEAEMRALVSDVKAKEIQLKAVSEEQARIGALLSQGSVTDDQRSRLHANLSAYRDMIVNATPEVRRHVLNRLDVKVRIVATDDGGMRAEAVCELFDQAADLSIFTTALQSASHNRLRLSRIGMID